MTTAVVVAAVVVAALAAELLLVLLPLLRSPAPPADGPPAGLGHGEPGDDVRHAARAGRGLGAGLVLALAGVPYALLALLVAAKLAPLTDLDNTLEGDAHQSVLQSPALLSAARAATALGGTGTRIGLPAAVAVLMLARRRWRPAVFLVTTVAAGAAADAALKAVVRRARPVLPYPVAHAYGASFPSGHTMGATIMFGALLLLVWPLTATRLRAPAAALTAVLVSAVAASRVLLGVHYPSDVLAGILAGIAWLAACVVAFGGWHRLTPPPHPDQPRTPPCGARRHPRQPSGPVSDPEPNDPARSVPIGTRPAGAVRQGPGPRGQGRPRPSPPAQKPVARPPAGRHRGAALAKLDHLTTCPWDDLCRGAGTSPGPRGYVG